MRKVKLYFTLTGRSEAWRKSIPKGVNVEFSNKDKLKYIRDLATDRFGDRAVFTVNEELLEREFSNYPEFYSIGWFVSDDEKPIELVVIDHGSSMASANMAMLSSAGTADWDNLGVEV